MPNDWKNKLYFGDNLDIIRRYIKDESVDLIYLDPPFNSNATYNVLFKEKNGENSIAQITAFEDTWQWSQDTEYAYREIVKNSPKKLADLIQAFRIFLGQNNMMAYLTMMAQRMSEFHRVLKPTGSIYLHCDPTASHYLKLLMDAVFGFSNFRNEIAWERSQTRSSIRQIYRRAHDILLFYTNSDSYVFNLQFRELSQTSKELYSHKDEHGEYQKVPLLVSGRRHGQTGQVWRGIDPNKFGKSGMHWITSPKNLDEYETRGLVIWPDKQGGLPRLKYYLEQSPGVPINDDWHDIDIISSTAKESLGYPTQKPEALLERIIRTSSNQNDLVLDPFCGCGTAIVVAERLHRRWIGIDITHLAITLMRHRLTNSFGPSLSSYEIVGQPKDLESAKALAQESEHEGRYQFEWWALGLVDARPAKDMKKGSDKGVDGFINFFDDNSGKAKTIIVQVKSGHVNVSHIHALKGVLQREKAQIGAYITLEEPTKPMLEEAATSGFYEPEHFPGHYYPRIQILTIRQLLDGKTLDYPRYAPVATFKKAPRLHKENDNEQVRIL